METTEKLLTMYKNYGKIIFVIETPPITITEGNALCMKGIVV